MAVVVSVVFAAMATVAAAQDAGANPPKECDKLIKDYEKQGVQGLVDTLQQVQAAPDDTDVVEGLQKLLPCSGFDSECQGIVAPILGANCLAEIVAVAGWVNKGGDAANASESIPEIKEALGPCCEGTITEPCCDSLPPLIASYGPNGWRGGCLCETNATERILGPDHEAFLSQVLQVVAGLGCDRMSSVPDVDPDTKVFPECAQQ